MDDPSTRLALTSSRVITPSGIRPATVVISGGVIDQVVTDQAVTGYTGAGGVQAMDFGDLVIAPGVIDAHVHVNDPGTDWEGFASATDAAAAGGITTLVDMPLNSQPVTTTLAALQAKRKAAAGHCRVNVLFYGGIIPGNASEIPKLIDAGVVGVKAFLCDSGLADFPACGVDELRAVMPILKSSQIPLLAHAEIVSEVPPARAVAATSYADFAASRPPQFELDAIQLLIDLCKAYETPVHIVHLAAADALPMLRRAKDAGLPLSVETCPHYLNFSQDQIPDGDTRFKCAPPIRDAANQTALTRAVASGWIDTVGSDHSPCPPAMKHLDSGDLARAWGGIAGLQVLLPATWTACRSAGLSLDQLAHRLSTAPARVLGIASRKGQIASGFDADLVVWDPEAKFTVDQSQLLHRHRISAYDGKVLQGVIHQTFVGGRRVYQKDTGVAKAMTVDAIASCLNRDSTPDDSQSDQREVLSSCCASRRWVDRMLSGGDFACDADVIVRAQRAWAGLRESDWLEAFAAHPRIGDIDSLRQKFAATKQVAAGEQSGCELADEETLRQLANFNRQYFDAFGFIFIVCATGKSAAEMLADLKLRLANDRKTELSIAASEQLKITILRLRKLAQ